MYKASPLISTHKHLHLLGAKPSCQARAHTLGAKASGMRLGPSCGPRDGPRDGPRAGQLRCHLISCWGTHAGPGALGPKLRHPTSACTCCTGPKCTRSVDAYQWIGKQAAYSLGPLLGPCLHATRQVATGSIGPARLRCLTAANAHVGRQPTPGEQAQTGPAAWQELRTCAQPSGSDTVLCLFLSHNSPMPIR